MLLFFVRRDNIKVGGYDLDEEQLEAATTNNKHTLVIAGAGSGKTTTIIGRIKYLIENGTYYKDILCISFTNASVQSLKDKLKEETNLDFDIYTFHKLSLEILKENNQDYNICQSNMLEYIIDEYLNNIILNNKELMYTVLRYYNIFELKISVLKKYKELNIDSLKKLIAKFIRLMKTNGYGISEFTKFYNKKFKTKKYYLLKIILIIYQLYQNELMYNQEIDFDDMIIKASNNKQIVHNYKHIIIDEYQDSSMIRFNLIKSILDKTGASLFVVGDDFQSIYKFAGCNLNVMLDFSKYFNDSKIYKINNTYRNSQELIDIAGSFVMKNPNQIKKNLKSIKHIDNPIEIIKYHNYKKEFKELLNKLRDKKILILGRNNNDIYKLIDKDYIYKDDILLYKPLNMKVKYLTVHKSKGLEEEVVIIINLYDDALGFPSKLEDDKILSLVSPKTDKYPYSEERRLFYVALTRTKTKVYLYTPHYQKSIFVDEIKKIVNKSKITKKNN